MFNYCPLPCLYNYRRVNISLSAHGNQAPKFGGSNPRSTLLRLQPEILVRKLKTYYAIWNHETILNVSNYQAIQKSSPNHPGI
jgi:hypothetical protein